MIGRDYAVTMARYNAEMNRRVYAAAARLPEAERAAERGVFWKSIQGTLSHILWADTMWLSRFGVGAPPGVPLAESGRFVPDFDAMAARRVALDADLLAWAEAAEPEDFEGDLVWWSGAMGREMRLAKAVCVVHIFNHQTHHRGQVHALLTRAGEDTGATDLPFVL